MISFSSHSLCVNDHESNEYKETNNIEMKETNCMVKEEDIGKDQTNDCKYCNEENPHVPGPILHDIPIKSKVLEDSLIHVSKLETNKVSNSPYSIVIIVDIIGCVCSAFRRRIFLEIVHFINLKE